jgi:tetratricopeptide (TPR) repeat protein
LGQIYLDQERVDEALSMFQKCLNIDPNNQDAHYFIAKIFYQKEIFVDAFYEINTALRMNPDDRKALGLLRDIYRGIGDLEEADNIQKKIDSTPMSNGELQNILRTVESDEFQELLAEINEMMDNPEPPEE